jgi:hypothetical protein
MALKEKTMNIISEEKMRVAACLFEDAPKALKTINSHVGQSRHRSELGEPVGYTARHTNVPSPYASSPTDIIHNWKGKNVFTRETAHKHYQTFEVPHDSKIHKNEEDAENEHIRKTYPDYKGRQYYKERQFTEEIQNPNSSGQGHDPEHHMHPHHATLLKHGYEYSHSTPVSHPIDFSSEREKINHHTYKLKGHPDHNVSVHYSPKMAGNHKWEAGKSASNTSTTGRSTEALDKFLKGHVARAKRAAKK